MKILNKARVDFYIHNNWPENDITTWMLINFAKAGNSMHSKDEDILKWLRNKKSPSTDKANDSRHNLLTNKTSFTCS